MRLFVAINLPADTRDAIYADAEPMRAATRGVRWVSPTALHVTIQFLGEQDERLVDDIGAALGPIGMAHAPVTVTTTTVGAFPNFRHPRVVWLGMTGEAAVRALARDVSRALVPLGIPAETRPFQAHLTLGRVKGQLSAREATERAAAAAEARVPRAVPVQAVDLMRSELGPGGSRYSVVASVPLHARGT
jgi:2'-5' RNA ligase